MKSELVIAGMVSLSAALGGCAVYPVQDNYYGYAQSAIPAPPPPLHENPGFPPYFDFIWISGNWNWAGSRYVWVPGRWEASRPGYFWVPHRWEHDGKLWRQHGGRWEREGPHRAVPTLPITPPPHPGRPLEHHETHNPVAVPDGRHETDHPRRHEPGIAPKPATQPLPVVPSVVPKRERDSRSTSDEREKPRRERSDAPVEERPTPARPGEAPPRSEGPSRRGSVIP